VLFLVFFICTMPFECPSSAGKLGRSRPPPHSTCWTQAPYQALTAPEGPPRRRLTEGLRARSHNHLLLSQQKVCQEASRVLT
jgi:hypothetical protein